MLQDTELIIEHAHSTRLGTESDGFGLGLAVVGASATLA
jgi:hypothetical protein